MVGLAVGVTAGGRFHVDTAHGAPGDRDRHLGQGAAALGGFGHAPGQGHRADTAKRNGLAGGQGAGAAVVTGGVVDVDDDEAGGGQGQDGQVPVDGLGEGGLGLDHAGDDLLLPRGQSEGVEHSSG